MMTEINRLKCCFVLIPIFFGVCSPRNETFSSWDIHLSTEQNIAKNAIALENSEDFSFLDKIVRDRSVVILGEEGHGDYSTSAVKIKMIDYLQKKGFRSIVLEGAPFLTSYLFSNLHYSRLTEKWRIERLWRLEKLDNKIYRPFIEKIQKREIRIWGMDCFSGNYYDIDGVKAILDEYSCPESLSVNWNKLRDFYFRKFVLVPCRGCPEYENKLSTDEQYELMRMIDSISNYTQYLMHSKGVTVDLKVIMQWIRNLNTAFSYVEYAGFINGAGANLTNRNRDIQMAENIDWILKNFPEEKFIVWCANFHGAKDISQTRYPADSLLYFNLQTMGETVYATYGDKMYSLAFTSLRHGKERGGEFEMEIARTTGNTPYAFINFEPLRFADGYRDQEFESTVIIRKHGKWLSIFDGIYYIRDQEGDYSKMQEKEE